MALLFNADEVFDIAIQIEQNGAIFYRKAAEGVRSKDVAALFLSLAEMEDGHEQAFAAMRREAARNVANVPTDFYPEESGRYLKAMSETQIFKMRDPDPERRITGRETDAEALDIALGLEKDSVVFYLAMKAVVPDPEGRASVDRIIEEEMAHVGQLSRKLADLRRSGG